MGIVKTVESLARPIVERLGLSLWDVEYVKERNGRVLRVVIDHPEGVSIKHCEDVSRELDPLLDETDPIPESYVLQVTSAGLERVLKRPGDFEKFLGHKVTVKFYKGPPLEGRLLSFDGSLLTIEGHEPFDMKQAAQVRLKYEF